MDSMLDFITATTRRLQRLVPTLRDPSLVDITADKTSPNADREDVAIVTDLFPQAPVILIQRLGRASWKRRQYLKDVRAMLQKQTNPNKSQVYIDGREADQEPKPNSKPRGKIFPPSKLQMTDISDHRKASFTRYRADSETASMTGTSASNRGPPTSTAGTSVADSTEFVKSNLFPVPRPPIPLEDGKRFQCSYCAHHLLVGKDIRTEYDWTQHVFSDLEPYMCTFANDVVTCMGVDKTYGSRQKWISHELDAHRSTMVWYCQRCSEEFFTDEAFESHLLASHDHRLERDQLSLMATLCKRSSVRPLFNDPCPLCQAAFFSADAFFAHLSVHFEQIALASIQSHTPVDEPLPTSPIFSTKSSEYGHKSNYNAIEYFVSEQHRRWIAQRREDAGGKNQGLQDMRTAVAGDLLFHEQTISPASVTSPRAGVRPAMAERAASYSYLEQARHLRNAMTGAIDQTVPSAAANPNHICVRTMAPARHQDFVGRLNDMAKVHHVLVQKGHMCIVNGVGGLGKSALVVEYTYLFESAYDYIFWIQAETPMRCAEAYSQIAITCVPYATPSQGQERLVALSREFLEQTSKRWLLVFDNVEHWRSLQSFLPDNMSRTSGSVLVTSNKVDISSFTPDMRYTIINLGTLGLDESRKLLLSATSVRSDGDIKDHPEYKLAGDVARMAERLPLALSLIAGYILVSELTLTEFVELWNERPVNIPSEAVSTDQQDEEPAVSMENVWNIGLREVPTEARELLNILAFFDSDNVQKDLLVGPHTDPLLEILHSSGVTR